MNKKFDESKIKRDGDGKFSSTGGGGGGQGHTGKNKSAEAVLDRYEDNLEGVLSGDVSKADRLKSDDLKSLSTGDLSYLKTQYEDASADAYSSGMEDSESAQTFKANIEAIADEMHERRHKKKKKKMKNSIRTDYKDQIATGKQRYGS